MVEVVSLLAQTGIEEKVLPVAPWAPWVTLLVALASLACVVYLYLHETAKVGVWGRLLLAAIRFSLVAIVLVMLYGWMLYQQTTDLPDLVVVLDDSASMNTVDRYDQASLAKIVSDRLKDADFDEATRFNLGRAILAGDNSGLINKIREKYNLKFYLLGGSARALSSEDSTWKDTLKNISAEETSSRLGRGLRDVIEQQRGRPTAAVVVISDGAVTEGSSLADAAQYARRKKIPFYFVGVGDEQAQRDIRLSDLVVNDHVFLGDMVNFDFRISNDGFSGQRVHVELRREDYPQPVASEDITLGADNESTSHRLTHRPDAEGTFEYTVTVVPLEGEATADNNQLTKSVRVSDETLKVLLVQAYPNYEFRFLKNLLSRQNSETGGERQSIELKTLLQESDENYTQQDATAIGVFPVTKDELFKFDVIIFGDVKPSDTLGVQDMENIAAFVKERGGGVIFVSGPQYTPLAYRQTPLEDLFPIDIGSATLPSESELLGEGYFPRPTRLGMTTPPMQLGKNAADTVRIWSKLPELYWLLHAPDLRVGARVLIEHPSLTSPDGQNLPVVCMRYVGAGKVIFHCTDETWRWRHLVGDVHFARYWIQAIRYLSRSKNASNGSVEIRSDRERYQYGEPVRMTVRFIDDRLAPATETGVVLVLKQQGGRQRQIDLNRSSASRGVYQATIPGLAHGTYSAWIASPVLPGGPSAYSFIIDPPLGESAMRRMQAAELSQAAKLTEGRFYTINNVANLAKDLPKGRQVPISSLPPEPVWNYWPWAAAFVLLIVTEWLLRKRWGMV